MKKLLAVAMAGGLMLGGAGIAQADHRADGSGHKPQDKGLCTALMNNGQKKGWEKNGTPPPFADLISRADGDDDGTDTSDEELAAFCEALGVTGPPGNSAGAPGANKA